MLYEARLITVFVPTSDAPTTGAVPNTVGPLYNVTVPVGPVGAGLPAAGVTETMSWRSEPTVRGEDGAVPSMRDVVVVCTGATSTRFRKMLILLKTWSRATRSGLPSLFKSSTVKDDKEQSDNLPGGALYW